MKDWDAFGGTQHRQCRESSGIIAGPIELGIGPLLARREVEF